MRFRPLLMKMLPLCSCTGDAKSLKVRGRAITKHEFYADLSKLCENLLPHSKLQKILPLKIIQQETLP